MDEKQVKSRIADGYIYVRIILEVVGKPKEHVDNSLKEYVKKIKADKDYTVVKEHTEKTEEEKDGLYGAFSEMEILFKNVTSILAFSFDYLPASAEVIEPERLMIKNSDFTDFVNDMLSRSITLNTTVIETNERNMFYVRNAAVLLRNFIVVLLSSKPMTIKQISPYLGVMEDDVSKVIDVLIKEKKVKKDGDYYKVIPKDE